VIRSLSLLPNGDLDVERTSVRSSSLHSTAAERFLDMPRRMPLPRTVIRRCQLRAALDHLCRGLRQRRFAGMYAVRCGAIVSPEFRDMITSGRSLRLVLVIRTKHRGSLLHVQCMSCYISMNSRWHLRTVRTSMCLAIRQRLISMSIIIAHQLEYTVRRQYDSASQSS
jgi:hypothetical protein